MKKLTPEQEAKLKENLPPEALKQHPTKSYLSTINSIYVVERMNDVFGTGGWTVSHEVVESTGKMVVVKAIFEVPEYGIRLENFGGNDNSDRGDAYKGACTDALTKIGSYLGIGAHVWRNEATPATGKREESKPTPAKQAPPLPTAPIEKVAITDQVFAKMKAAVEAGKGDDVLEAIAEKYQPTRAQHEEIQLLILKHNQTNGNLH